MVAGPYSRREDAEEAQASCKKMCQLGVDGAFDHYCTEADKFKSAAVRGGQPYPLAGPWRVYERLTRQAEHVLHIMDML